ncbi:hypothetical protein BGX38DRAFT_641174 [Terfezia claveryi]|nr:hypothetical protein BGX38DRAFT_641174 [Terfezia claveryi]
MRDESFDDTPSTPVRTPLHPEDEGDLPTPTELSPYAIRLNTPGNSPTRAIGTRAEVAVQTEDNALQLSYNDDLGSVPVISDTRPEPKGEKGEDGGKSIGPTTQQEPNTQTKVVQEAEAMIKGENGQAVKDGGKGATIATNSEAEAVKEEANGFSDCFGDSFCQSEETKDNEDGFAADFGDDFDDFGEAVEGDDGFEDFEGFEGGCSPGFSEPATPVTPAPPAVPVLPVPVIDFDSFDSGEDAQSTICNIVSKLYPNDETGPPIKQLQRTRTGMFLTERSESLWNQLVATPPLQPPDWKRSRIRRLFLVSLGVPVDLDEILPASKQKKLILPSTKALPAHLTSSSTPPSRRSSIDSAFGVSRHNRSKSRNRAATGSRAPSSHRASRADKNPPMPEFDEFAARILCTTSDLVLAGMREKDLREHINTLQDLTNTASELLTWWLKKRDGAMGDKETFETVIESLVGYARKTRTGAR